MIVEIFNYPKNYKDIIYMAGRNCFGMEEIKGDVTEEKKSEFIKKIIKFNHGSVLEHVYVNLYCKDVSRSFMSQITRHRHVSFAIKSQHYCKHNDFKFKEIELLTDKNLISEYHNLMKDINIFYKKLNDSGLPHWQAREVLPNSCCTNIFMTLNMRELRYIIDLRIKKNNTPEIIEWSEKTLKEVYKVMPEFFEDYINKENIYI